MAYRFSRATTFYLLSTALAASSAACGSSPTLSSSSHPDAAAGSAGVGGNAGAAGSGASGGAAGAPSGGSGGTSSGGAASGGAAGASSGGADAGSPGPLSWIVGSNVVVAIHGRNAALAKHFFDHATTYETGNVPYGYTVTQMQGFQSYAAFSSAVAGGSIPSGVVAVRYDNEKWPGTPVVEQNDPATYMTKFTNLAHAHHYIVVLTPARDLMAVSTAVCHTGSGESTDHAYLRCGIPAEAVNTGAEVFEIQSQADETNTATYTSFTRAVLTQARGASAKVVILAGLTTMRAGDTAALMEAGATSVIGQSGHPNVAGFWLNVHSGTASEVTMATDFLNRLRNDGY